MRKCSMCGSYKQEKEFRYMKKQNRYNCYCRDCERLYNKEYQRIYRERKIKKQQLELEKKDKIINLMLDFIEERIDECPYDFWIESEKELNCKECEEDYKKCWRKYFERKVENEN